MLMCYKWQLLCLWRSHRRISHPCRAFGLRRKTERVCLGATIPTVGLHVSFICGLKLLSVDRREA